MCCLQQNTFYPWLITSLIGLEAAREFFINKTLYGGKKGSEKLLLYAGYLS